MSDEVITQDEDMLAVALVVEEVVAAMLLFAITIDINSRNFLMMF